MAISEQVFSLKTRKPVVSEQVFSLKTRKPVNDDDDDMVDDDEMLTEEDKQKKVAEPGSDCRTRKKACDNCTCGRAEEEQLGRASADAEVKKVAPPKKIVLEDGDAMPFTGCGSCSLGDAFRCASCPFLGQPSFQERPDGKIKLNLMDDL